MSRASSALWTPANVVTVVRICLVPVFVVALLSPWPEWLGIHDIVSDHTKSLLAAFVFILISCTDWVDGYLARSRGEVTDLGKLMDPLADKILVAAALLALIELQVLPTWPVLIILAREFIVSGVRMLAASKGIIIAASWYGKAKTVFQIAAVIMFLMKDPLSATATDGIPYELLYIASWLVMLAALVLTVISMVDYVSKAWPLIRAASEEEEKAQLTRIDEMAAQVVRAASEKRVTLSVAESLTGGMISESLTSIAGSSQVFLGGVVSYALSAKEGILGVDGEALARDGAVCALVASQMATGSAQRFSSDISVAVTGIAGPGGAEPGKPVGTVFIGACQSGKTHVSQRHFNGNRHEVREQTTFFALKELLEMIEGA